MGEYEGLIAAAREYASAADAMERGERFSVTRANEAAAMLRLAAWEAFRSPTPENVECRTCDGFRQVFASRDVERPELDRWYACPDCTRPGNVETPDGQQ